MTNLFNHSINLPIAGCLMNSIGKKQLFFEQNKSLKLVAVSKKSASGDDWEKTDIDVECP